MATAPIFATALHFCTEPMRHCCVVVAAVTAIAADQAALQPGVDATPMPHPFEGLVSWLHIPKCGSSFIAAVAGAFCPKIPSEHSAVCPANSSLSYRQYTAFPERQCSSPASAVPYCNAKGQRPLRSQLVWGVEPSYIEHFPADEYCLPGFRWDTKVHRYLPSTANVQFLAGVVTMLREPRQRLISAFDGGVHMCEGDSAALAEAVYSGACNSATFARVPGIEGCQVRMATGCRLIDPSSPVPHCRSNETVLAEAMLRLRTFGFVGLVEDWETSIDLFHATYGGVTVPSEIEDSRPSSDPARALPRPGCDFVSSWHDEAELDPSVGLGNMTVVATPTARLEPMDTALHAAAILLFYERAQAAGLVDADERAHREWCLLPAP